MSIEEGLCLRYDYRTLVYGYLINFLIIVRSHSRRSSCLQFENATVIPNNYEVYSAVHTSFFIGGPDDVCLKTVLSLV